MICKNCGKEIENGHVMCPACGALIECTSNVASGINWEEDTRADWMQSRRELTSVLKLILEKKREAEIEQQRIKQQRIELQRIRQKRIELEIQEYRRKREEALIAYRKRNAKKTLLESSAKEQESADNKKKTNFLFAKFDEMSDGELAMTLIKALLVVVTVILTYMAAKDKEYRSPENAQKRWEVINNAIDEYEPENADFYERYMKQDNPEGYDVYTEIFKEHEPAETNSDAEDDSEKNDVEQEEAGQEENN